MPSSTVCEAISGGKVPGHAINGGRTVPIGSDTVRDVGLSVFETRCQRGPSGTIGAERLDQGLLYGCT